MASSIDSLLEQYDPQQTPQKPMPGLIKKTGSSVDDLLNQYDPPEQSLEKQIQEEKPWYSVSAKGLLRSTAKALPAAGGLFGGAIGGGLGLAGGPAAPATVPLGAIGGAAAGTALGESLKQIIEQQGGLEEGKTLPENLKDIATAGLTGATSEMGGQVLAKGLGAAPGLLKRFQRIPKENVEEIAKAGERLGATPTKGMTAANPEIGALESTLSQSPTIAGGKIAKQIGKVKEGVTSAAEGLVSQAQESSPFQLGEALKDKITSKIGEKLAPLQMSYDELANVYKNVPLSEKVISRTSKNLRGLDIAEFPNTDAGAIVHRYADMIENAKNAASLRTLQSEAGRSLNSAQAAGKMNEVYAYGKVIDALKKTQQSQVLRAAVESAGPGKRGAKAGAEVANEVIKQLKDTNKGYRALMEEAGTIGKAAGVKAKSPTQFLDAIENINSEQLSKKMFNTNKYKQLMDVKEALPEEFELLRKAKLDEIAKSSQYKGNVDPAKLLKNIKSLPKEAQTVLFGDKSQQAISDIETLLNARPELMGPSGTPQGLAWSNLFSPGHYAKEVSDAMQYMLLKNSDKIRGLIESGKTLAPKTSGVGAGVGGLLNKEK